MKRVSLDVQRLSFGTLFKIFALAGFAVCLPFCVVGILVSIFAPQSVNLNGGTMTGFFVALIFLPILWPTFFALFFSSAAWIALVLKSGYSSTTIEVIQTDRK